MDNCQSVESNVFVRKLFNTGLFKIVEQNFVRELTNSKFNNKFYNDILNANGIVFGENVVQFHYERLLENHVRIICSKHDLPAIVNAIFKHFEFHTRHYPTFNYHGLYDGKLYVFQTTLFVLQVFSMNFSTEDMKYRLQNFLIFDKYACRVYNQNGKTWLAVPIDVTMNPFSENLIFNSKLSHKAFCSDESRRFRIDKFAKSCKFVINEDLIEKFFAQLICCICLQPTTVHTFWGSRCFHVFHRECQEKWTQIEAGDDLVAAKNQCPCCKTEFVPGMYSGFLFDTYTYTSCISCRYIFQTPKNPICSISNDRQIHCGRCSGQQWADEIDQEENAIEGQLIICPNCRLELQHGGGCNQFACCLYGIENCETGCDHGFTEFTQFCGYQWTIE